MLTLTFQLGRKQLVELCALPHGSEIQYKTYIIILTSLQTLSTRHIENPGSVGAPIVPAVRSFAS